MPKKILTHSILRVHDPRLHSREQRRQRRTVSKDLDVAAAVHVQRAERVAAALAELVEASVRQP